MFLDSELFVLSLHRLKARSMKDLCSGEKRVVVVRL